MAIVAGTAIALPLLLAASPLVDVYDGRNVIAAWAPLAVLVAIGLGVAARAARRRGRSAPGSAPSRWR